MNTKKAKEALLEGKKVRRKGWHEEDYISYNKEILCVVSELGVPYNAFSSLLEDVDDWEFFKEEMTFAEAAKIGGVISNGDYELIIDFYAVRRGFKILSIKELIDLIQPDDKIWYTV
jgi:hypothetical protein